MAKKTEKSPLQELADKADAALFLCWKRLQADDVDEETIRTMVQAWRVKRHAYIEAEEQRQERKEQRESDNS